MKSVEIEGKIRWCSRKKGGISLVSPNENLCKAYLKKANDSLKSMNLNMNACLFDWAVDAAYYARYQAVYALLQKCGIKSEIHDCSIALLRPLFGNRLDKRYISELETAKEQRKNMTYYTDRMMPEDKIRENIRTAPDFVLKLESIISELNTEEEITDIRNKLRSICWFISGL